MKSIKNSSHAGVHFLLLAVLTAFVIVGAEADPVSGAGSTIVQSMSGADAYRAIPHQRTTFTADSASMPAIERRFIRTIFALTDIAVAERVQSLHWFQTRGKYGSPPRNYDTLIARMDSLVAPSDLGAVKDLITSAVKEQQRYFAVLDSHRKLEFDAGNRFVQSSHGKLIHAYRLLMSRYPQENAHNKKAFFDHLCALDFI